jgi:hypothetical protein
MAGTLNAVDPTPPGLPLIIPARLGLACPPGPSTRKTA